MEASMAIIAITTNNSINVNPGEWLLLFRSQNIRAGKDLVYAKVLV